MATKTGQEAWRKLGWGRDPIANDLSWISLPEKVAALVADDPVWKLAVINPKRGTGRGFCAIAAVSPADVKALLITFAKLAENADTKALAKFAIHRLETDLPLWNKERIVSLQPDGWPGKRETTLTDVAVHRPKAKPAAKTPRRASSNPRTQARKLVAGMAKRQAARKATETEQAMADAIVNRAQA